MNINLKSKISDSAWGKWRRGKVLRGGSGGGFKWEREASGVGGSGPGGFKWEREASGV